VVRKTVAVLPELNAEMEGALRHAYGLEQVHVVDAVAEDDEGLTVDLGHAAAPFFVKALAQVTGPCTIGFTS
jgi:DNA-binding transcriptional regulator LsrR (DeoR family)